ncbi:MerR family transcriptional regulator [Paraburkholderia eburnea]|uniref:S-adenosyl-L-methionine-dependent methyltransferase n=1 Tax=Paraburkholderia eburnea TaxID=1189126 RepID=A0A2S4M636_9BURK|nr:class I SAM-dependent methyltransferase [Paraburkholderia eburnea]POR50160.1 MerR family transcriptional regulator [Paraburkholderia eburnea]PRZ20559.1 MerR family transcriptional regulator [Paraburkholderia eburnea]
MPAAIPDSTAIRTALWRALHVQVDAEPHVLEDELGMQLAAPDAHWRERPDMDPEGTRGYRASIVGRARLIEDLVAAQVAQGVAQYVLLGAGLDTFAQRRPEIASRIHVYEIDHPDTQTWKRQRLADLGFRGQDGLRFVAVDFEAGESWRARLAKSGFDATQRAVVASTGVSMYLTREANLATLREVAQLAPGSTLAMTFTLPLDMIDEPERSRHAAVYEHARAAGTPFVSFFRPDEMLDLAREVGFSQAEHIGTGDIVARYFSGRSDALKPAKGESFLIATV